MIDGGRFDQPTVIRASHDILSFRSGEASLDDWLRTRALKNLALGASRTFVICPTGSSQVVGFYALSMGSFYSVDTPGSIRRNMPDLIPSVMLGRLAIDESFQGHGLGALLLRDAIDRSFVAAENVSARLMIVHAISEKAERFYLRAGFTKMSDERHTLALDFTKYGKI